jgi:exodeoxyribonuclease-3
MFKAATFNANSIRSRLPIILAWLEKNAPDVLCVQETKVQDPDFPIEAFRDAGYHVVFKGEKSYNGVAIISRREPAEVSFGLNDGGPADEARLAAAKIGPLNVVNTYVPQGTAVGDPRFQYKLEWFARLRRLLDARFTPRAPLVWMGDLNVAPEPIDVYDPAHLAGSVCFHPDEQAALKSVMEWGFIDVFRKHCGEGGQFTFWDYRIVNSVKRNIGWRLDHILATKPLAAKSTAAWIDREPRLLPKPSDHTFLVAEFDL